MIEQVPARRGLKLRRILGRWMARRSARALSPDLPRTIQRAKLDRSGERLPAPDSVAVEEIKHANCAALRFTPDAARSGAMLYLHGGGYSLGSAHSHKAFTARLARAFGLQTLSLNYRLAPEHVCPAALDDAVDALRALIRETSGPVVLAGDSAGGGLALAAAVAMREAGQPGPDALVLFSPWVDLTCSGESMTTRAQADPMLKPGWLETGAKLYLDDRDPRDPKASPLFADLKGLAPVLIQAGTDEILLDDSVRLADKLEAAGVDVRCEIWSGLWHDFQMFAPLLPEAESAMQRARDWLVPHLEAAQS